MIKYNNGMPNYWKDETSGQMAKAVEAYWDSYLIKGQINELSPENIASLKLYLIHWAEAPCYRNNEYATAVNLIELDKAIASAHNINNIKDVSSTINILMQLGLTLPPVSS